MRTAVYQNLKKASLCLTERSEDEIALVQEHLAKTTGSIPSRSAVIRHCLAHAAADIRKQEAA